MKHLEYQIEIDIKPLSVNEAWQGRRFKTDKYRAFQKAVLFYLPKTFEVGTGKLSVSYEYGFSNKASDIDNPCKLITDILQKKYKFNDSQIYELHQYKVIVPKGKEYIKIGINPILRNKESD